MKKVWIGILLVITVVIAAIVFGTSNDKSIDIKSFDIIINCAYYDENDKEQYNSSICTFYPETMSYEEITLNNCLKDAINILQLDSQRLGAVDKDNNFLIINNNEAIEKKVSLDFTPEKMVVYDDSVLLYHKKTLYKLDLIEEKVSVFYSINETAEDVFSDSKMVACTAQEKVYIKGDNIEKEIDIDTKYKCLGFLNEETLLFSKELCFGFIILYHYGILKKDWNMAELIHSVGGIYEVAISPDSEYLLYFSSNGEGALDLYLLKLNSKEKIKFSSFKADCVDSMYWVY